MPVNHEVKGTLAKLLATENLVIEHKKVATACFDVLNRVLTLPIWDKASATVYDLLVGHEVGHALYTPTHNWMEEIKVPKDYVNVIEDARVEKLMKRKYPGLGRSFFNGYKELNDADFFSIANEDMKQMSLIDRINLHFKISAYACIPFKEEEQQFVDMTSEAETFADVLEICKLIYEYIKDKEQDKMDALSNEQHPEAGGSGGSQQSMNQNNFVDGDAERGDSSSGEETSDFDNNKKQESQSDIPTQGGGGPNEEVSKTQRAFDEEAEKLTEKNSFWEETVYVEVSKVFLDKIVFPNNELNKYLTEKFNEIYLDRSKHWGDIYEETDAQYRKYKSQSQKEVNYLVKEFEMKKSADAYARTGVSKTGVLNTSKLHTYKYNEDLFKKVSVIPDGKNHGLIFVLDWSGSMEDYLLDTVKQLLNLVWFCKKSQIPFEVYGFTYEWNNIYLGEEYDHSEHYERKDGNLAVHNRFSLLNFLSSTSNSKSFETDCLNLWRLAYRLDRRNHGYYSVPNGFELSGTPLNESIIALHQIIPQFKNNNKLQKVNVVILTDGESNGIVYDVNLRKRYGHVVDKLGTNHVHSAQALRDRKTGRVYRNFGNDIPNSITTILLENLKHNFPEINLIGFRILNGSEFGSLVREVNNVPFAYNAESYKKIEAYQSQWKKEKSAEINEGVGYDALYAISSSNLSAQTDFVVEESASTKEIGKAFRGMLKKKTTNKKILSSFVSLVA